MNKRSKFFNVSIKTVFSKLIVYMQMNSSLCNNLAIETPSTNRLVMV